MSLIYRPSGKAGEYGELALNIYKGGCPHRCLYCYVPAALKKSRYQWENEPLAQRNLSALPRELERLETIEGAKNSNIFLCFTCDPYPSGIDSTAGHVIETILRNGFGVTILTKGGLRSRRDFDLLRKDPQSKYGATLTFWMASDSLEWEPGAAQPGERIEALREAHSMGIRTWASLEPVIDTGQSLELIRQTKDFVDEYKIGKWNHDERAKLIDWKNFGEKAVALCRSYGKNFYVKKDLAAFLGPSIGGNKL